MFFPDRINPLPGDRVLEVGPGATPNPSSQIFLDKRFADSEAFRQRGGLPPVEFTKPVIYYDGGKFPFRDNEFDYVICSHVLEHTENPQAFLGELGRVAGRGYLEFPTIHYDYLYNFKEHVNLLLHKEGEILWMPKDQTPLHARKVENVIELVPSRGALTPRSDRYPPPSGQELARELVRRVCRRIRR